MHYRVLLDENVRKLDLSPDGIYTIFRINDLKNSRGLILFKALSQGTRLFNLLANRRISHQWFCEGVYQCSRLTIENQEQVCVCWFDKGYRDSNCTFNYGLN
ncbi:ribosomal RNA small subunit methyltransferase H [Striga asiatica]|uniref:Ribosomal RNA small subunit methyltransferase H n=1 Tax=Striga asiatica TaxID=4170 RepID=A0A5A7PGQ1_STRAF|nr:ribosomal RNA small subunit methyltransferase H [Striga asiatica]